MQEDVDEGGWEDGGGCAGKLVLGGWCVWVLVSVEHCLEAHL